MLYFIPSLWVLSMLCFSLSKLTPDDPVLTELGLPVEEISGNQQKFVAFRNQYVRIVEKNGFHLPLFYISISSLAGRGDLDEILFLPEKRTAQKILAQNGNFDDLSEYLKVKKEFLSENKHTIQPNLLQTLDTASNLRIISAVFTQIVESDNFSSSSKSEKLQASVAQLNSKKDSWKSKIPILIWNGSKNQYHQWMSKILNGNWGISSRDNRPVWQKIWPAFKWTISLNAFAISMIVVLSVFLGLYTSARPYHIFTRLTYSGLFLISSLPVFLLAIIGLLVFSGSGHLGIFPTPGAFPVSVSGATFSNFTRIIPFLILPLLIIILYGIPGLSRQVHNIMTEELRKEYVYASILRRIPARRVINQYAWKNALATLSVYLGRLIPALVSGSIVIESVFNLPGMGSLLIGSIVARDAPVVFGIVLLGGSFSILGLLIADAVMYKTDPNILQNRKSLSNEKGLS